MKYKPGAYWFGVSKEHDLAFANRLHGKTKTEFIKAVNKSWSIK